MKPQFHQTTKQDLIEYIEHIEGELKNIAPGWEINIEPAPSGHTCYYLRRKDLMDEPPQSSSIHIGEFVFAYHDPEGNAWLSNKHPIQSKKIFESVPE